MNDNLETYIYIAQDQLVELAQRHNKQDSNCFLDSLRRLIWSTSHQEFLVNIDNCISWIFNGIDDDVERNNESQRIIALIDASERISKNEATDEDIDVMTDHFIEFMDTLKQ